MPKHQKKYKNSITGAVAVAVAATGLAAGALTAAPAAHAAQDCSNVYFLVDGHTNGTTGRTWANTVVPAGSHRVNFFYDDGIFPVAEPHDLDTTQRVADPALEQQVVDFHKACPNAHITLTGYSFGALIAGNVAASLASKTTVPHQQLNAILIADPRRAISTTGVEGAAGGIMSVLPDLPGMHMTSPRDFKDVKYSEVCRQDDPICNLANPISNAVAAVNQGIRFTRTAHTSYGPAWVNPAAYANGTNQMWGPTEKINWGAPAFASPTPNQLLNPNSVYQAAINGLSQTADAMDWAKVLNSFGLPGDSLIHMLVGWAEASGVQI